MRHHMLFATIVWISSLHAQAQAKPLAAIKQLKLLLFFIDPQQNQSEATCDETKRVIRSVNSTGNIYEQTISHLLGGPSQKEVLQYQVRDTFKTPTTGNHVGPLVDYFQKILVANGTARIYFSGNAMDYLNSAACAQRSVKSPIEKTLKAFPDIEQVEYYIDGKLVEDWDA